MTTADPIVESDLNAYVDDQLDVARRIEVEAYLSQHPPAAAQVMADLRIKDELRLALAMPAGQPRLETRSAARHLEQALGRRRTFGALQRVAGIALFIGAGWVAHGYIGPFGATAVVASIQPPGFVREAIAAHETALLRHTMASQTATIAFDPAEIRAATAIQLPQLPEGWKVIDTQVFPSTHGPSVEVAIEPKAGTLMSLYAERPGTFAVQDVLETHENKAQAAYWQIGDVAYALVADSKDSKALDETARRLARTLY